MLRDTYVDAISAKVDKMVTLETPAKPMLRVAELNVMSIYQS